LEGSRHQRNTDEQSKSITALLQCHRTSFDSGIILRYWCTRIPYWHLRR